jgi:hypothetical protein
VTGKPDDIERVTSGLAGGRRERSQKTTSPAAYPTTITVSTWTMTRPFQAFDSWNQRRTAVDKNLVRVGGSQLPQLPWKLER